LTDLLAQTFTALVLAASRDAQDPVARAEGKSHKALVDVAGTPMLSRVVRALADSSAVGSIAVSIDDPSALDALGEDGLVTAPTGDSPGASVIAAAGALGDPYPLLVTTGDHPLLTAEIIDRFCADVLATGADVVAGLATEKVIRAAYPETRRTFLRFREGGYSGCNLFAMLTPDGLKAAEFWGEIERERKRPWRLIMAFGVVPLILFGLRLMSLNGAFRHAGKRFGNTAAAVLLPWAEAAIDVDKPADLELVRKILGRDR
jgi:GTP:adenosylcobinamide-phosphate guanylyltransferase